MHLKKLLSILPIYDVNQNIDNVLIKKIEIDHRKITAGDLFICIKGFTVDGHDFAKKAIEKGAVAILAEKKLDHIEAPVIIVKDTSRALAMLATFFFGHPSKHLSLIGITGTNGKTTTTYLLESIFQANRQKTGLMGTIQMKIGEETFPVTNTTPNALVVQKNLYEMVQKNVDVAIMEVSSHALDLRRVNGCDFEIAVYTNLSQDHLDYHKDLDDYIRAKSLLFSQLGNDYCPEKMKFSIVNQDDPYSDYIQKSTSQPLMTYGIDHEADVMAKDIQYHLTETIFTLETPIGKTKIHSKLLGRFNVYNMLAAASVAIAKKLPLSTIKLALEGVTGIDGRFEQVLAGQNFATIVDYAHTPDSLENVLKTIQTFSANKIYVVVGCGGDRDRSKRPLMAKIAAKYANLAIYTTDNPRTEKPEDIIKDMTSDLQETNYEVIIDRKEAIQRAVELAEKNDVILIAGKGHETYQEINHVRYDFDDRLVAKEAILAKESKSCY